MRFLCLHGRGTNAEIFTSQTARLREALGPGHDYVFINGNVRARAWAGMSPDTAYGEQGLGFWPLEEPDQDRMRDAYRDLRAFVAERGPFDGLMAFSEGASIGATLMVEHARCPDGREPAAAGFSCAVFFCGLPPLDLQLRRPDRPIAVLDPAVDGVCVRVPTAHIWSTAGQVMPDAGRHLAALCDPESSEELVHELGHHVPGSLSEQHVRQAVRAIERTLERAKACP